MESTLIKKETSDIFKGKQIFIIVMSIIYGVLNIFYTSIIFNNQYLPMILNIALSTILYIVVVFRCYTIANQQPSLKPNIYACIMQAVVMLFAQYIFTLIIAISIPIPIVAYVLVILFNCAGIVFTVLMLDTFFNDKKAAYMQTIKTSLKNIVPYLQTNFSFFILLFVWQFIMLFVPQIMIETMGLVIPQDANLLAYSLERISQGMEYIYILLALAINVIGIGFLQAKLIMSVTIYDKHVKK